VEASFAVVRAGSPAAGPDTGYFPGTVWHKHPGKSRVAATDTRLIPSLLRLYDLRHTAATLALAAGVSAKVVSEQLGHASSAFTLDVYSHLLPHMQSDAARRVAALLGMDSCEREGICAGARKPPQSVHPGQLVSEAQPCFAQDAG